MSSMKQQGCEIEAVGINYQIYNTHEKTQSPFARILKRSEKQATFSSPSRIGDPVRGVLNDVDCRAKPWEVLAIVGPSGAGKSTLLEVLAGRITPQSGSIFVNDKPIEKAQFRKISGYVTQKDILFPLFTVEETLMFTAKLRLRLPYSELSSRVKSLIQELGLSHVAATRVGDDRLRGISGGERRRVSIGVDVIHDPRVLILDEPTSGLDSTSALQIIGMLRTMAETRGRTVILSIHQPGFRIVKMMSSILVLANGSVMHQGTVEQLGSKLRLIGLELPLHVNIVEFAIESIDTIEQQHPQQQQQQQQLLLQKKHSTTLQQLFHQSKVIDEEITDCFNYYGHACSRWRETMVLSHRFAKNILRTKELFWCRTLQMLVSGLVLGSIFYQLDHDLQGAMERAGLFAFILTFLLSTTTEALPVFLQEREMLMKETSSGSYRVSSYAIANSLVYLPFLLVLAVLFAVPVYWLVGLNPSFVAFVHFLLLIWLILYTANSVVVCFSALVPNFIVGNSVIQGVMGSFFLFSGYFISSSQIPSYWIGMHYLSLFKYPYEGFLINEFAGSRKCLEHMFGVCAVTGNDVLREQGLTEDGRWRNVFITVIFIVIYRLIAYVILRFRCCGPETSLKSTLL
ncbi:ATP-binding cassette sub- G member 5 [Dionaea muscipula]